MKRTISRLVAGAAFALVAPISGAATLIDISAYDTATTLVETKNGEALSIFGGLGGYNFKGDDALVGANNTNATLTYDGGVFDAKKFAINLTEAEFLFEDGGAAYYFRASYASLSDTATPAHVRLERLSASAVPLPSSMPLVLVGLGAFAIVRRKRSSAV